MNEARFLALQYSTELNEIGERRKWLPNLLIMTYTPSEYFYTLPFSKWLCLSIAFTWSLRKLSFHLFNHLYSSFLYLLHILALVWFLSAYICILYLSLQNYTFTWSSLKCLQFIYDLPPRHPLLRLFLFIVSSLPQYLTLWIIYECSF